MSSVVIKNITRFIGIFILQVLILSRVDLAVGTFAYIHLIIYPYVLLLLPFRIANSALLAIGFGLGLLVDMFYNSPGVHAAAMVICAYLRPYLIALIEPYEGYNSADSPTLRTMGYGWFLSYISIMMAIFLFAYFSLEAFSFVYIFDIVLNTVFTFIPSILIIAVLQILFKSKY